MTFIEDKIKSIIILYFKHRKKYIYNMITNIIIKMLKNYILSILPDLITICIILLRFYKLLYYTKIILDQVPMVSLHRWPFSFLRIICRPYTRLSKRLLPKIKIGETILDISNIVGVEVLNKLSNILLSLKILSTHYVKN